MREERNIAIASSNYERVEGWCNRMIRTGNELFFDLKTFDMEIVRASITFGFPVESLVSLLRNIHLKHVKRTSNKFIRSNNAMRSLLKLYNSTGPEHCSILELAKKINYPPYMMARAIVENVIKGSALALGSGSLGKSGRKNITEAMRDPIGKLKGIDDTTGSTITTISTTTTTTTSTTTTIETVNNNNDNTIYNATAMSQKGDTVSENVNMEGDYNVDKYININLAKNLNLDDNNHHHNLDQKKNTEYGIRIDPFSGRETPKTTSRLAREVLDAIDADPLYGPRFDKERHYIGLHYEILLEQNLLSMKIPFETERQLRKRGTARTPDVLLSYPIAIKVPKRKTYNGNGSSSYDNSKTSGNSRRMPNNDSRQHTVATVVTRQQQHHGDEGKSVGGCDSSDSVFPSTDDSVDNDDNDSVWKMVCWIDSKALFGDVHTHQTSVLPQAETYVHRFGPGLVLYWFGHAPVERLGDGHGDVAVAGWDLPDFFLLPSGDIVLNRNGSSSSNGGGEREELGIDTPEAFM